MVLHLPPPKYFILAFFTTAVENKQGIPQHGQWNFLGGDPARTVKYHGFTTTPLKNFTVVYIYRLGRKQEEATQWLLQVWQWIFWGGTMLEL